MTKEHNRKVVVFLLVTAISSLLSGCGGILQTEPCYWQDLAVYIHSDSTSGESPLTVSLEAYGDGFSCGCCGGREPTYILNYSWDLDDDGGIDIAGTDLTKVEVTLEELGEHTLWVYVSDTVGDEECDMITIEITQQE